MGLLCVFFLSGFAGGSNGGVFFFFLVMAWVVGRGGKFYPYL